MSPKSGTGDRGEAKEGWAGGPNRPPSDHPHTGPSAFPVTGKSYQALSCDPYPTPGQSFEGQSQMVLPSLAASSLAQASRLTLLLLLHFLL